MQLIEQAQKRVKIGISSVLVLFTVFNFKKVVISDSVYLQDSEFEHFIRRW